MTTNEEVFEDNETFEPTGVTETTNESVNDGVNDENGTENTENTETPESANSAESDSAESDDNSEDSGDDNDESPIEKPLPEIKTIEDVADAFPETAKMVPPVIVPVFGEMLSTTGRIGTINATLAQHNNELTDEYIVTLAASRDEPSIVKAYRILEKKRQEMDAAMKAVIAEMEPILNEGKPSEDEIKALRDERKELITTFVNYKGSLATLTKFVADSELDLFNRVLENLTAPGMRKGAGSVKTSGATGITRPRLNGGKVHVNGTQYETVSAAASKIQSLVNGPFTQQDLVEIWCQAAGVQDWTDIANGVTEFTVDNGRVKVAIEKMAPKPKKKEDAKK